MDDALPIILPRQRCCLLEVGDPRILGRGLSQVRLRRGTGRQEEQECTASSEVHCRVLSCRGHYPPVLLDPTRSSYWHRSPTSRPGTASRPLTERAFRHTLIP